MTESAKRCCACCATKSLEDFNRHGDGHQSRCRECQSAYAKKWNRENGAARRERTRAESRAYARVYNAAHKAEKAAYYEQHRDRLRAENKRRYEENREVQIQRAKDWVENNTERVRANQRRWEEVNRVRLRPLKVASAQRRRARLLDAFVEDVVPLVVLERDAGICGLCGHPVDPDDFHVDHIIPLSRGGEHSYANTQVAHPFCNVSKGARLPEELAA